MSHILFGLSVQLSVSRILDQGIPDPGQDLIQSTDHQKCSRCRFELSIDIYSERNDNKHSLDFLFQRFITFVSYHINHTV